MASIPRVFISYSHDSAGHDLSVLELANRLRSDGVDAVLDRYEAFPAEGWPRWMTNQLEAADFILVVCSKNYRDRFEGKAETGRGATWEGLVLTQSLYEALGTNDKKIVPVLLDDESEASIPTILRPFTYVRLPEGYETLLRLLTNQPAVLKVPLGETVAHRQKKAKVTDRQVKSGGAVELRPPPDFETDTAAEIPTGLARRSAQALEELSAVWRQGKLTLVVGAGVSAASGLPTWDALLNNLLVAYVQETYKAKFDEHTDTVIKALREELGHLSPITYAEFIQSRYDEDSFLHLVHKAMYGSRDGQIRPGALHVAVARLGHRLSSIVSFNYDDLMEQALRAEGHECSTICNAVDWSQVRGLPVFHPHGFLPQHLDSRRKYKIVLAESDYHTQYTQPYLWSNIAVARVLLESTCLFVGTSMRDPNLRRLLDTARRERSTGTHYVLDRLPQVARDGAGGKAATAALIEVLEASHERLGIKPIWCENFSDVTAVLDSVRRISVA